MVKNKYKIKAVVWIYPGPGGWHFISIPKKISEEIKNNFAKLKKGWGSLPVTITVGKTTWQTSIFPDTKMGVYLLPFKAEARKKERIIKGIEIKINLEIKV
ncbi:MAG TPA: DUF1905 domain-containing protein [Candidatus Udaeobacter sp.]|nr:DUF1905 domain-containing protein [Candidatus Udaeobacter sp.]